MKIKKVGSFLLDLFFPKRCPWCGEVIGFATSCCEEKTKKARLGIKSASWVGKDSTAENITKAWACFEYVYPIKDAILRMKFENEAAVATQLGQSLAIKRGQLGELVQFDIVVAVPVSPHTLQTRGFNQSILLAKEMLAFTDESDKLIENALVKNKETEKQMNLTRQKRLVNVFEAYTVGAEIAKVNGKTVLLLDDVLVTGSTLNECARVLIANGATKCVALTVAASMPDGEKSGR